MSTPLVQVGTYTGVRPNSSADDVQRIPLDFEPDWILIVPETTREVWWTCRTSWHQKSQGFASVSSQNYIGAFSGSIYHPLNGNGFSVRSVCNLSGITYRYIAIADNGSGMFSETSWIGNEVDDRVIDFVDQAFDVAIVKRDGGTLSLVDRPGMFRFGDAANTIWGTFQGGTGNQIKSLNANGITISNAVQVNENSPPALGEGCQLIGFRKCSAFDVVTWTGDGELERAIQTAVKPDAVIVLDGVNDATADTERHVVVTADMTAGVTKPFDTTTIDVSSKIISLDTSSISVGADFNVSGRVYYAMVFAESSGTQQTVEPRGRINAVRLSRSNGRINLEDNSIGSSASTIEFYGRVPAVDPKALTNDIMPLVMFGGGAENAADGYNGGLYLGRIDPDSNDWHGWSIRWIQFQELRLLRTAPYNSINLNNLNSGTTILPGEDIHVVVTFDGGYQWRVYLNGKQIKDYTAPAAWFGSGQELEGLTFGGTGSAKQTVVGALSDGADPAVYSDFSGLDVYRVSWSESAAMTRDQVAQRYLQLTRGSSAPSFSWTKQYDFTVSGTASGASITGGTVVERTAQQHTPTSSRFQGLYDSAVNVTSHTATNGIPGAGKWLVGVVRVTTTSSIAITGATGSGVAMTRIGGENDLCGATNRGYFDWYIVETVGSGNVVMNYGGTTLFSGIAVYDATGLDETQFAIEAAYTASLTDDGYEFTPPTRGCDVFTLYAFTGGNQTLQPWVDIHDGAYLDDFENIGASSRVACASHLCADAPVRVSGYASTASGAAVGSIAIARVIDPFSNILPAVSGGVRTRTRTRKAFP